VNYFAGKRLNTVAHVIAVETGDGRMDCSDDSRIKVWLCVPAWSTRRAMLTDGDEFFRVHGRDQGLGDEPIEHMLSDDPVGQQMLPRWAQQLAGVHFFVDFTAPDDEAEAAERIEFHEIRATPPIEDVKRRLGIPE
jgi:hypothetical protein